jgi:pyruvate/2-oxoglutarate/acetoin dehydrogenase E1 component
VTSSATTSYGESIRLGFEYLLENYSNVFALGQGLWSPWYVGSSMMNLEKRFGRHRVIDTPISELACTGAAVGASLCGLRAVVIHPRMDFMLLAVDQIVNQAAKWSHMLGGQAAPAVTIRAIINRGGEQGAQHSQALHAWFAHIPGLRVVMPSTPEDARDLLIASVLCDDPVMYIDDRWLYERRAELPPVTERPLAAERPRLRRSGTDVTLVGVGYSAYLCEQAGDSLAHAGVSADVIDLRVINPLQHDLILESVTRTRHLCVVDGGWRTAGLAGEIIATVAEHSTPGALRVAPMRITLPDAPAPTSKPLESAYYPCADDVARKVLELLRSGGQEIAA